MRSNIACCLVCTETGGWLEAGTLRWQKCSEAGFTECRVRIPVMLNRPVPACATTCITTHSAPRTQPTSRSMWLMSSLMAIPRNRFPCTPCCACSRSTRPRTRSSRAVRQIGTAGRPILSDHAAVARRSGLQRYGRQPTLYCPGFGRRPNRRICTGRSGWRQCRSVGHPKQFPAHRGSGNRAESERRRRRRADLFLDERQFQLPVANHRSTLTLVRGLPVNATNGTAPISCRMMPSARPPSAPVAPVKND